MLLLLVILTFFLVFTGVSCNQANTKKALTSIDASQGVTGSQAAQVNACVQFAQRGEHPHVQRLATRVREGPGRRIDPRTLRPGQRGGHRYLIGEHRPADPGVPGAGMRVPGLIVSMLGALGLVAARSRALVTAIFSAGAGALLILDQFHVHDALLSKISSSEGSSTPGLDPTSLFHGQRRDRADRRAGDPWSRRRLQPGGARRDPGPARCRHTGR